MMEPIEELERMMMDEDIPHEYRVLIAIKRFSWGNAESWAVDLDLPNIKTDTPAPMTQKRLAERLNIAKSTVNEDIQLWKEMKYLRENHPYLYPEDCCQKSPLESTEVFAVNSDRTSSRSPFLRLRKILIERKIEQVKNLPQLEKERNELWEEAKRKSQEIRQTHRYVLHILSDLQRGKNPLNLDPQTIATILESAESETAA